ncbi:hypothetical protein BC834DRAFT_908582 [Gloeopeniophorella convolvens]|nr:hypothetical protein BC834DRAFT_908582 [Gloeopeniophorella convolvens]
MVAYCNTALRGDTCADDACTCRHDVMTCELCERTFPVNQQAQHENAKPHLKRSASIVRAVELGIPLPPLPRRARPVKTRPPPPPSDSSSSPGGVDNRSGDDPRVIVSHSNGLELDVSGMGSNSYTLFPSASCGVVIEKTEMYSSLSVRAIEIIGRADSLSCFSGSLTKPTRAVRQNMPRKVRVTFQATRAGTFHATMKIDIRDSIKQEEFTITRKIRARAVPPGGESVAGVTEDASAPRSALQHKYFLQRPQTATRPGRHYTQLEDRDADLCGGMDDDFEDLRPTMDSKPMRPLRIWVIRAASPDS